MAEMTALKKSKDLIDAEKKAAKLSIPPRRKSSGGERRKSPVRDKANGSV